MRSAVFLGLTLGLLITPAFAVEYRSVAGPTAVLYDGPSARAKPLYVLNKNYPLAIVVTLGEWEKVRDMSGTLAWIEKKNLSDKRTLMVSAPVAEVKRAPEPNSPPLFRAEKNVLLELLEYSGDGWLRVRHADGQVGYVPVNQVWGA